MVVSRDIIDGTVTDSEAILAVLREEMFPAAIALMNGQTLPFQFALYDTDRVPTNQRNLTDVRTRMGVLLEYELAKVVNQLLPEDIQQDLLLSYVIANKYPDLAFRTRRGGIGVRFEVKSIQTIAEEPAANFDTLLKDIRRGTDFVVVMVWEWRSHGEYQLRYPYIDAVYIFDSYQLAQMRDCFWLNKPPKNVEPGRQGYDLCFGVNCRSGDYNQEEGNYGKLMRIFEASFTGFLPPDVRAGSSLGEYHRFRKETLRLGSERIALSIAGAFIENAYVAVSLASLRVPSRDFPIVVVAERPGQRLVIIGDERVPSKRAAKSLMRENGAPKALLLNAKFDWWVRDADWRELGRGKKPEGAKLWLAVNEI